MKNNFKRRTQRLLSLLTLFAFLLIPLFAEAQVTIGAPEKSVDGALLQLKDVLNVSDGSLNAHKGLALPRVTLSDKNQLYPMFLANPDVSTSGPNTDYTTNKTTLDAAHIGLIVYNLTGDDDKELCVGLNQWDGSQWNCFENKIGKAKATLGSCDSLTFAGLYQDKVALNSSNYMTIPLHVTKAGAYTITAMPNPQNGYYFTTSGVFLSTGYYYLTIPGTGTPIKNSESDATGNLIEVTFNETKLTACDPLYIDVIDSSVKPRYSMTCSSTVVNGVYQLDKELDSSNSISVTLSVESDAIGATYIIQTNTVDGIYFKGQGLLTTIGTQTVTLQGYGTPNSYDDKFLPSRPTAPSPQPHVRLP